jgi:hypothetical protein
MTTKQGCGFCWGLKQITFLCALLLLSLGSGGCSTLHTKTEVQHFRDSDRRITQTTRDGALIYLRAEILKKGKEESCYELVFYKKKPIFTLATTAATESRKASVSRDFVGRGGIGIGEMDTDGDGLCDLLAVTGPKAELIEAFRRDKEGHLAPLSDQELENNRELVKRFAAGFDALVKEVGQEDEDDDDPELR